MSFTPHPDLETIVVSCAAITVSDTRTPQNDRSGQLVQQLLQAAGHQVSYYTLIPDEPSQIAATLAQLDARAPIEAVIINGGTGIAPRDTTYDALAGLLDKTLPGFGELFRFLSFQEIGARAIASRAIAGTYRQKLLFSLPGSPPAVRLALKKLILPELPHLVGQLRGN